MANPPQRTECLGHDSTNRQQDARPFGRFFGETFFRLEQACPALRIEEAIRFIKPTYERLRNMAVLVNAVAFFTAVCSEPGSSWKFWRPTCSRPPSGSSAYPTSAFYALADGIREVCARSPRRSQSGAKDPPQLTLGFG
jgi:hypothetical protein